MTRKNDQVKNESDNGHQRSGGGGGMSSLPPDLNKAHVSNVEKLEKDVKSQQEAPVEQHRSSRRPRQRR
jgi:hypothetical protein